MKVSPKSSDNKLPPASGETNSAGAKQMKVYSRYARAFFEILEESKQTYDFEKFKKNLTKKVIDYFNNPIIDQQKKNQVIEKITDFEPLKKFLKFLINKKRFDICSCISEIQKINDKKNNILRGVVTTATTLSTNSKKMIENIFSKKLNKKLIFDYNTDPNVLGGIRVLIGDVVFEDTIKNKLNRLKESIK